MEPCNLAEAPTPTPNRNELKVLVLTDLAEICKKVAENSAATETLRRQAGQFVAKFNSLVPYRGKGDVDQHVQAEKLLIQIARFLPEIAALQSWPCRFIEPVPPTSVVVRTSVKGITAGVPASVITERRDAEHGTGEQSST